jgi:hypothetical protein
MRPGWRGELASGWVRSILVTARMGAASTRGERPIIDAVLFRA